MTKITAFLDNHPAFRSAIRVASYTFLGVFLPALLGWLGDVNEWVNSDGSAFPSVSVLTKALVSAFSAVVSGFIAYIYNSIPVGAQSSYGPPTPGDGEDRGESTLMTIVLVLIAVVLVVFLLGLYSR